jgi:TonB-linked SusC/RagA family outer membrane protein
MQKKWLASFPDRESQKKLGKIMKLIILFFFGFMMTVSANSYSQKTKLDVNLSNTTIKGLFEYIERNSEFVFLYRSEDFNTAKKVDIELKEATVYQILDQALKDEKVVYDIYERQIVIRKAAESINFQQQQKREFSGTVKDKKGVSLPGVTVIVKGSTIGSTTDTDGQFKLSVPAETTTLIFSFIGMKSQTVNITGRTSISITMEEETIGLEEVVAIGYGVVKKSDLTGSVSKVNAEVFTTVASPRIDQALQGKASGVQVTSSDGSPGAATSIRIRGGNSINASNEPLYVIDGFIDGGDINNINTNDVESIEILKDATSTSIYGARGANGVILITTKRGKEGKSSISVSSSYGVQTLSNKINFLNGPDRAAYATEYQIHNGQPITIPDLSSVKNTDWQEEMTVKAPISNTNISFSGGNKSVKYFLSGNYFNQDGIIINSGFKRYQTRLNLDFDLYSWLKAGATMNISRTVKNNNKVDFYELLKSASTTAPVYKDDGSYNDWTVISGNYFNNPMAEAEMVINNTYSTLILGNYYLAANFKNGLSFKSTFGFDLDFSKTNNYIPGALPRRQDQKLGGYAKVSTLTSTGILNENTVTYLKAFGEHSINLMGGATYQHSQGESLWASGDGFTNDVLEYNKLSTGNPLLRNSETGFSEWTILSFIGRANYSFRSKYLLTLVSRFDGSSRLAKNHKWAYFPSVALAWRIGDEQFIKDLGVFSNLKLRTSYGKTGNQAIDIYSTLPSLEVTDMFFNGAQSVAYRTGNLANPDLKWETTDQFDVGLEAGFFKGRLSFEFDAYYKRTHDLLFSVEIPEQTGYTSMLKNIGEIENRGVELLINAVPVKTKDFSWDISFNIATNKNKVLNLGGKEFVDVAQGSRLIVGQPAIVFYGMVYEGTWHTQAEIDARKGFMADVLPGYPKFKDVDGNGKFEKTTDREILGSPQPDFFGGIQNTLKYKKIELYFDFQGSYGNEIYNTFGPSLFFGQFATNIHEMALDRWTSENYMSDIPRAGSAKIINVNSDTFSTDVQDGSFIRLKSLRLTYNVPVNKVPWLNKAQVYVAGNNLFCLNNYTWGFDLEVNSQGTNSILRGYDAYTYPNNRSFMLGVNFEF